MNLAYLIGVMLGDGGVYGNYYTVFCRDPNPEFVNFIARTVQELFGINPHVRRASTKYYLVSTNVKWVHDFFLRIGFPKGRKLTSAEIPPLYRNDLDVVKGLFDSEGYCGIDLQRHGDRTYAYPYVGIDMIARPVIRQARELLLQHGIRCSHQRKRPRAWGKHYQWRLVVKGWEEVAAFAEEVGFRHPDRSRRLQQILVEGGILRDHTPRAPAGNSS